MVGPPARRRRFDLYIRLLGRLEVVRRDGSTVPLGPKMRAVMGALSVRPRQPVSVERLIDGIWPGVGDELARHRLHTSLSKLRRSMTDGRTPSSQPLIRSTPAGYLLDVADEQLDWVRFRRLAEAGAKALRRGQPDLARSYLTSGLALWSGVDPLAGVEISPDDMGFVTSQVAAREAALRDLMDARLWLGEYGEVTTELETRVDIEPVDSDAVEQLALAYYWSGRRDRALGVCGRYLRAAAGLDPGWKARSVSTLRTAILNRDVSIETPMSWYGRLVPSTRRQPSVVSLAAYWESFSPSIDGPVPAELHLVAEAHGGHNMGSTDTSVETSFDAVRPALETALAIQRSLGHPPYARIGVDVHPADSLQEAFEAASRARARQLASGANEGQILVGDVDGTASLDSFLPMGATLLDLGRHRLGALSPTIAVLQLIAEGVPSLLSAPRWLPSTPVHNMAPEIHRLIGREAETAYITDRLTVSRLVTLTGAPGSGKTRLAGHVATGVAGEYADGVWFVDLQPVADPELLAGAVADALQAPLGGSSGAEEALTAHLQGRQVLIVLDNCEHLLRACADLVDGLVAACPGLAVLATSRIALGSTAEDVIPVAPLVPPPLRPLDAIIGNTAVQLFYERLGTELSAVADRSDRELASVARICRAVDGIPLALVLAAARAREVGIGALADALDTSGDGAGLHILAPPRDGRHILEETFQWSYQLLGEGARRLLDGLSVFRSGFTLEDAVAVCIEYHAQAHHAVLAALDQLVGASLVEAREDDSGTIRFRLLEPIRGYAMAKLAADPHHLAAVQRSHAMHFLAFVERLEPELRGGGRRGVLDSVDASLADLYAAIRWAARSGESEIALRVVGSLWVFWLLRGRILEGLDFLETTLAADRTISTVRAKALIACSQMAWHSGAIHRVPELCREALWIAEALDDPLAWAWAPLGLAAVEMFGPEDDGVPQRMEELIPRFRALGNDWDTGQAIQTLGGAAWHRGRYDMAEQALSESMAMYRSLGHPTLMASLLAHGLVLALLGSLEEGASEVEQSIVAAYEAGDLVDLTYALVHRGSIARYADEHALARHHFRDALSLAVDVGQPWMIQWALVGLAGTETSKRDSSPNRLAVSVILLATAARLARETGITLAPRERELQLQDLETARSRLGERDFQAAYTRGQRLSIAEAVELALSLD